MKYYIRSANTKFKALIEYDIDGVLTNLVFENKTPEQVAFFMRILAESTDIEHIKSYHLLQVKKAKQDLSFTNFWNTFDNKVGDKAKARKLWNNMNEAEQQEALFKIPIYKAWIGMKGFEQALPTTWLRQRRYEDDYKF